MTEENDKLEILGTCSHGNPIHFRFPCEECLELNAINLAMAEEDAKAVEEHLKQGAKK